MDTTAKRRGVGALSLLVAPILLMLALPPVAGGARAAATVAPHGASGGLMGDVNCSGVVDTVDALQVLRLTAGLTTNANCMDTAGDTDCSGDKDSVDSLRILRFVAGLAVQTPPGCTAIGDPMGGGPSSADLIDQALANHTIDEQTALLYKIYAYFGDAHLPAQYKGDDSGRLDDSIVEQAAQRFASFSTATQAALAPFLKTPAEPGSWLEQAQGGGAAAQAIQWGTVNATRPVKVWWQTRFPADEARAHQIADAIDSDIWPKLTGLMQQDPLPDCGAACPSGGGDSRLDIYLGGPSVGNFTVPNPPLAGVCEKTATYITIGRDPRLGVVAHEFMHAIQRALDLAGNGCAESYDWFREASSTWAEDYVYRDGQTEHDFASDFLDVPGLPLDDPTAGHEYGAYLFPFYLARKKGQPEIVRSIWQGFQTTTNSLQAIDDALTEHLLGDFDEQWPQFALYNWNREPIRDYRDLDGLNDGASAMEGAPVKVSPGTLEVSADVSYLAAMYHDFVFSDDSVHSVVFENTVADYPHAKVQALVKVGGQWKDPEDWTHDVQKNFCRDLPEQRIEELVIIISYANWQAQDAIQPSETPTLRANNSGCSRWFGGATAIYHNTLVGDYTETATTSNVVFERVPPPSGPYAWETFKTVSGTVKWEVSGSINGCSLSGSATGPVKDGDGFVQVSNYLVTPEGERRYLGSGASAVTMPVTMVCPKSPPVVLQWQEGGYSWFSTGGQQPVGQDGSHLVGQFDSTFEGAGAHYTWAFSAAP